MSNINQRPMIAGVEITTDSEGRFNLNALHRASGGEKRNGPAYWLDLETTHQLVGEFKRLNTGIPVFSAKGRNGGTFAVEQLAVAYANWVSPTFYLKVIDTFLDYKKGKLQPASTPMGDRWIFDLAVDTLRPDGASKLSMLKAFGENRGQDMQFLPDYSESQGVHHALSELLKRHHSSLSARKANQILVDLGYLEVRSRQSKTKGIKQKGSIGKRFIHLDDLEPIPGERTRPTVWSY